MWGYNNEIKCFRFYNTVTKKLIISHDIIFNEKIWNFKAVEIIIIAREVYKSLESSNSNDSSYAKISVRKFHILSHRYISLIISYVLL